MQNVQTIDRLMLILNCFSDHEPELSMTDISQRIGLTTSTTHRLLTSMAFHGLLSRAPDGRRYRPGYKFIHLAAIIEQSDTLQQQARPLLESLSKETGETAVLMVRDNQWAVCLDRVDSAQSLRLAMTVGERIPLHAGSSAKILLAYLEPAEIEAYITTHGLPAIGKNTITDPQTLRQNLQQIRQQGVAISIQERDPGAAGLTAPIFDQAEQMIAAIGIVGPVSRLTPPLITKYKPRVQQAAAQLSQQQGHLSS